jgi:ribosomal protein S1
VTEFIKYEEQFIPEELIDEDYLRNTTNEIGFSICRKSPPHEVLEKLYSAKARGKTILAYCIKSDTNRNLYVDVNGITGTILPDEITYHLMEDRLPHKALVDGLVGFYIRCIVKEIVQSNGEYSLLLSRKDVNETIRNRYWNELKQNMIVEGVVLNITQNQAIVGIGGDVIGILGVRNISRTYVNSPSDVLKVNQRISVIIDRIKRDENGIILYEFNRKDLLPSFDNILKHYNVGDTVLGTIQSNMGTGYFVKLNESYEGIAKYIDGRRFEKGDQVKVQIRKIDVDKERINLLIK